MRSARRGGGALIIIFLLPFISCKGKDRDKAEVSPYAPILAKTTTLATREAIKGLIVDVPAGSVSLTIVADGGDAGDIDISGLIDPDGNRLIVEAPGDDLIGRNRAQAQGQSTVAFTFPHTGDYDFSPGQWKYDIKHWDSPDGEARKVSIYTIINPEVGDSVDINLWLVGLPDYQGANDPIVEKLLSNFRNALGYMGIALGKVKRIELTGDEAANLTYIDLNIDRNENGQPDGLDKLFAVSGRVDNDYINIFLISSFTPYPVIGIAGGIPGPQLLQGTAHSGVAVSALGGLTSMSEADLFMQGDTMAHELGHYLGLFHTTERNGDSFDPLSDTPECDRANNDANGDGIVSSSECEWADGKNLMFWAAAHYQQDVQSTMQKKVLSLAPAVYKNQDSAND